MFKYSKSTALALAVLALTLGGTAMAGSNDGIDESLYSESGWVPFVNSEDNGNQFADNNPRLDMESQEASTTRAVSHDSRQAAPSVETDQILENLYRD